MDVLIIDDDPGIRNSTRAAIEAEGHYVEIAEDAGSAKLRLKEEKFDLLLVDLRLGEASGAAVASLLVRAACATHNGMATFAEAGVSGG